MQVFISWSGEPSQKVAHLFRDWLPNVLQSVKPFLSAQDIAKGARGIDHIAEQLSSTDYGVLILTRGNVGAPWVNFEAGALSKSLGKSKVIPILCGIREIDIPNSPLRQFQHAKVEQSEIREVVIAINQGLPNPLDAARLNAAFDRWWPEFDAVYSEIPLDAQDEKGHDKPAALDADLTNILDQVLKELSSLRREVAHQSSVAYLSSLRSDVAPARDDTLFSLGVGFGAGKGSLTIGDLLGSGLGEGKKSTQEQEEQRRKRTAAAVAFAARAKKDKS